MIMNRLLHNRLFIISSLSSLSLTLSYSPTLSQDTKEDEFLSTDNNYQYRSRLTYSNSGIKQIKGKKQPKDMVLIGGSSHPELCNEVSTILGVKLADADIKRFADGECCIRVNEEVRGRCVYIIQPCGEDTSDNIMELLLTISAVKRGGCKNVTAVIPYFPFKHYRRGMPKSKKLNSKFLVSGATDFAKMLEAMSVDRVISVGLQRPGQGQEACFFDNSIPLEDISPSLAVTRYFKENIKVDGPIVLMSPNDECLKKAVKFEQEFRDLYPDSKLSVVASVHKGTSVFKDKSGDFEILGKFEVNT